MTIGSRAPSATNPLATPDGFGRLYAEHSRAVLLFFLHRVPEPELAMDLTAETFAQALVSRDKFRGFREQEQAAWLFAIARHQLKRFIRRGKAERKALKRLGLSTPMLTEEEQAQSSRLKWCNGLIVLHPAGSSITSSSSSPWSSRTRASDSSER